MEKFTIILVPDEITGDYIASMPEVPEIHAPGTTAENALKNLQFVYDEVVRIRAEKKQPPLSAKLDWTEVTIKAGTWETEVKVAEGQIEP